MDKTGQSVGFAWIVGLMFLFALGLGYVIFNQVLTIEITSAANGLIDNSPYLNASEGDLLKASNDKYLAFWHSMPFIIMFLIAIFLVVTSFRKGDNDV